MLCPAQNRNCCEAVAYEEASQHICSIAQISCVRCWRSSTACAVASVESPLHNLPLLAAGAQAYEHLHVGPGREGRKTLSTTTE
jgi:hypothetical protein